MARFLRTLIIVSSFVSQAAFAQFVTGTIAGGMGGAGRAAVDPGEGTYLNPGAVAHLQQYVFGSHWQTGNDGAEGDRSNYGLILADGTPGTLFPGSFAYTRKFVELPGTSASFQDIAITLGGFVHRRVSFGVTAHRVYSSVNQREDTQDNAIVGILVNPARWMGIGAVVHDVANSSDAIPAVARLNRTYSVGAHVMMTPIFRVRLDLVHPERQSGYEGRRTDVMAGLETFFRPEWAFRAGTQWRETRDQTNATVGLGYRGPRLSFDYSFQKDVRSEMGARHLVDLWVPL